RVQYVSPSHVHSYLCLLSLWPPPTSTLFPYTTLFRSWPGPDARLAREISREIEWAEEAARRRGRPARRYKDFLWSTLESWSRRRDRKSTRLNSSHVKNSYAVFCLKKKKEPRKTGLSAR